MDLAGVMVLFGHDVGVEVPWEGHAKPSGQSRHATCLLRDWYVPAGHGTSVLAPSSHELPSGQTSHLAVRDVTR
jgi:hypothetical protein